MAARHPLVDRFVIGVDVRQFSMRNTRHQGEIQRKLDWILSGAAEAAGLNRELWERRAEGDGEVALLPQEVDLVAVVRRFVSELDLLLTDHNKDHASDLQIRLRLAMHMGTVTAGKLGYAGPALVTLSRLLDSHPVREGLAGAPEANLALIVSEIVYQQVVVSELDGLRPALFRAVEVALPEKGFHQTAYLYVVGERHHLRVDNSRDPADNLPGPEVFVSHAVEDTDYVNRLADLLRSEALPIWRNADLEWGDRFPKKIPAQIEHAVAVIVVMSESARASDWIELEILEAQRHDRPFLPILLSGERFFLLASSHYFDARTGRLPGERELRLLRKLLDMRSGRTDRAVPITPPFLQCGPFIAPTVHVPLDVSLDKLHLFLKEGRIEHADIMTTSLILDAAGQLEKGWMDRTHAAALSSDLLGRIDTAWASLPGSVMGFRVQLARHPGPPAGATPGGSEDFFALAAACGWKSPGKATPRYAQFVAAANRQPGFFPTLRNPQLEHHQDWYDRWLETVMAVHLRIRMWGEHR